jgi:hypothetical protein
MAIGLSNMQLYALHKCPVLSVQSLPVAGQLRN